MSARSIRNIVILAVAAATMAFPAAALAGGATDSSLSAVDSIASDVSVDGTSDSSSDVSSSASDSATSDTYGGSTDSVPPPVTCDSSSGTSSDSSSSTDSSSSSTDSCTTTDECSTEGGISDSEGNKCETPVTTTTETPTVTECTDDATVVGDSDSTVCGGGGVEEAQDIPEVAEPVAGGGEPVTEALGGGGPELPFTGLPLWYAIYGGIGLVLVGLAFWVRARFTREG
jgi:hypothetical protein